MPTSEQHTDPSLTAQQIFRENRLTFIGRSPNSVPQYVEGRWDDSRGVMRLWRESGLDISVRLPENVHLLVSEIGDWPGTAGQISTNGKVFSLFLSESTSADWQKIQRTMTVATLSDPDTAHLREVPVPGIDTGAEYIPGTGGSIDFAKTFGRDLVDDITWGKYLGWWVNKEGDFDDICPPRKAEKQELPLLTIVKVDDKELTLGSLLKSSKEGEAITVEFEGKPASLLRRNGVTLTTADSTTYVVGGYEPYQTKKDYLKKEFQVTMNFSEMPKIPLESKATILSAPMGSGKTHLASRLAADTAGRVVVIVPLRKLAREASIRYGIPCYLDVEDRVLRGSVVVCAASVGRISDEHIDLLVIDESESVSAQICCDFFSRQDNSLPIVMRKSFQEIIKDADHTLLMDAGAGPLTVALLQMCCVDKNDTSVWVVENNKNTKTWKFVQDREDFFADICLELDNNRNVSIAVATKKEAKDLAEKLQKKYKKTKKIHQFDSGSEDQEAEWLKNINAYIGKEKPNAIIYTPVLATGISIDISDYFSKIFFDAGIANCPIGIDLALQMVSRPRYPTDPEITAYIPYSNTFVERSFQNLYDIDFNKKGFSRDAFPSVLPIFDFQTKTWIPADPELAAHAILVKSENRRMGADGARFLDTLIQHLAATGTKYTVEPQRNSEQKREQHLADRRETKERKNKRREQERQWKASQRARAAKIDATVCEREG